MKKYVSVLIAYFICFPHLSVAAQKLDSIVAVVNDDVVTQSELNRSVKIAKAQTPGKADNANFKKQVLSQLIDKKLQMQIAKQVGIKITDADIDRIISNVASKNNLSVSALYDRLRADGMSPDEYRGELREQLTVQKLQQQEIASHISVSPSEIKSFMNSRLWKTTNNASKQYHLEDILIPVDDDTSATEKSAAKNRAAQIATKLNNGVTWKAIASKEKNVENHDLGWRKLNEIPSLFTQSVINMKPNEVVGPIEAGNGFHVIRLIALQNTAANNNSDNERKQIEQFLLQRKFQQNIENWVSKARGHAFISMK